MSKENKNTILKGVATTAAIAGSAYAGTCYYIFKRLFYVDEDFYLLERSYPTNATNDYKEWFLTSRREDDFITSHDSVELHAIRIENHPDSNKWAIILHGTHSKALDMKYVAYEFDKQGYNVLLPDARGCGLSKGSYTSFGWLERYDLLDWINDLTCKHTDAKIVLYGVTLGASTIMNASGDYTPKNIVCAIEDTGYSNIVEIIANHITNKANVKGDLFLPGVDFFAKQLLHFSIHDVDAKKQLARSHYPILFMHNKSNENIPARMAYDCFYACTNDKDIVLYNDDEYLKALESGDYFNKIFAFITKFMNA